MIASVKSFTAGGDPLAQANDRRLAWLKTREIAAIRPYTAAAGCIPGYCPSFPLAGDPGGLIKITLVAPGLPVDHGGCNWGNHANEIDGILG